MNKKVKVLLIGLLIFLGLSTNLSAKSKKTIKGNTYLVKTVNDVNIDMGDLYQMFIVFDEDELAIVLVQNGEVIQSETEEYEYDEKKKQITEFTEQGEVVSTIKFKGDDIYWTTEDGSTVMFMEYYEE